MLEDKAEHTSHLSAFPCDRGDSGRWEGQPRAQMKQQEATQRGGGGLGGATTRYVEDLLQRL